VSQILNTMSPLLQAGFAGAWLIQFIVGVWLALKFLRVLDKLSDAMAVHSEVVREIKTHCEAQPRLTLEQLRSVLPAIPAAQG
jgi:hypothetical protein